MNLFQSSAFGINRNGRPIRTPKARASGLITCLLLFLIVVLFACHPKNYEKMVHEKNKPTTIVNVSSIGNQTCQSCHTTIKDKKPSEQHSDCEGCHGGGSIHQKADNRFNTIAFPDDSECLKCHKSGDDIQIHWDESQHKKADIKCYDCHQIHSKDKYLLMDESDIRFKKISRTTTLCLTCHQNLQAKINMPSHHPIKEGALGCTDCHNPHAGKSVTVNKNELCFKCHQDKQGPFVFEHAPVAEDCTNCHDPHGAPNAQLLTLAQPTLCLQCHSLPDNRHSGTGGVQNPASYLRHCTNCHGIIHGSHQDKLFKQ